MALLDNEDLAYLRATQDDVLPTDAVLTRKTGSTGDGMGGRTATKAVPGVPIRVRLTNVVDKSESGDVPVALAARYAASDLVRVHAPADTQPPLTIGDTLVAGDRRLSVVSESRPTDWSTALICWAAPA